MGATISLRSFGQRNSWSFDRLYHPSTGSFKLIVLLLGVVIFALFGGLILAYRGSVQPVTGSLDRLSSVSDLMQQTLDARALIAQYLASGDADAYAAGEATLTQTVTLIERMALSESAVDNLALRRLETVSADYLNLIRSLETLALSNAAADTQRVIRQRIDETALALDQQAYAALQTGIVASNQLLHTQIASLTMSGIGLLLALGVAFGVSFALTLVIGEHSAYALHQIGQAARQITLGNYDTRIDLRAETNPDIAQLAAAFNRMTQTLKVALESESAANKQNGLQLMKLARQERMTAVLEERQRIARELHDSVKQELFSITLSAGAAINLLDHAPDLVRTHLEHIRQAGHTAQAEMTALLQELIPVSLQDKRLEDALLSTLTPLCETHGIKLLWRVDGTNTLTIAEEHALLRAVQEAAANVVRHSNATLLRLSFSFGLVTHVIVEDNGDGFVPEAVPATSNGLALMRTRLKRVGGRCEVQTEPGVGTRLTIHIDSRRAAPVHA